MDQARFSRGGPVDPLFGVRTLGTSFNVAMFEKMHLAMYEKQL